MHLGDVGCVGAGYIYLGGFITGDPDFQVGYIYIDIDIQVSAIVIGENDNIAIIVAGLRQHCGIKSGYTKKYQPYLF
jgi:hypothetical protein